MTIVVPSGERPAFTYGVLERLPGDVNFLRL